MGDGGSNLLGFMLAVIAVLGVYTPEGSIRELAVFSPLLILAVPILDTLLVMIYRKRKGAPLMKGDRNHLTHRLTRLGLSLRESVLLLYLLGILMGILALLLPTLRPYQAVLLFFHALGLLGLLAFLLQKGESRMAAK
jgi:UDP-GlcNAc:undecaprenyl-phosphate GlcNAc-1-phosphate transferase